MIRITNKNSLSIRRFWGSKISSPLAPSPVGGPDTQARIKINTQKLNLAVKVELVCYRIHNNIERKYFRSVLKRRHSNKMMICSKEMTVLERPRFR